MEEIGEVKERPILFSAPMVRAILDGRKTQTRRLLNPQPRGAVARHPNFDELFSETNDSVLTYFACPYGHPGNRLWVRETWRTIYDPATCLSGALDVDYKADGIERIGDRIGSLKWKPSIFMPKWASRIKLTIVNVRIERLADISEQDAKAEGVKSFELRASNGSRLLWGVSQSQTGHGSTPRIGYKILWESINGKKHSWKSNPWVWVIEFKKL